MASGNSESLDMAFHVLSVDAGPFAPDSSRVVTPAAAAPDSGTGPGNGEAYSLLAVAIAGVLGVISMTLRLVLLAPFMGLKAAIRFPWAPPPAVADQTDPV